MDKKKVVNLLDRVVMSICYTVLVCTVLFLLDAGRRIFVYDQFITPTNSMIPTLLPGDRIWANKLLFGGRLYKKFDFTPGTPLESMRMPGFRQLRPNDVIVFNDPDPYGNGKLEFDIQKVFCKRLIGTPGDTVSITDGFFRNSNFDEPIGSVGEQQKLSATPDSLILQDIFRAYPYDDHYYWTMKDFGPLYIPRRGDRITLDPINYAPYKRIIEYEVNGEIEIVDDILYINDKPLSEYTFANNYYFLCGDNVLNSGDSRYWGLLPEEFIIGVVKRVAYSKDRMTGELDWNRIMKRVK